MPKGFPSTTIEITGALLSGKTEGGSTHKAGVGRGKSITGAFSANGTGLETEKGTSRGGVNLDYKTVEGVISIKGVVKGDSKRGEADPSQEPTEFTPKGRSQKDKELQISLAGRNLKRAGNILRTYLYIQVTSCSPTA